MRSPVLRRFDTLTPSSPIAALCGRARARVLCTGLLLCTALLLCSLSTGCAAENDAAPLAAAGPGADDTFRGAVSFEDPKLTLAPGETATYTVSASPLGRYLVRFSLLGDVSDGSVDQSEAFTSNEGRVLVRLTAPRTVDALGAKLTFRAAIGETQTDLQLRVAGPASPSLVIAPDYRGGRATNGFTALALTNTSCADQTDLFAPDVVGERFDSANTPAVAPRIVALPLEQPLTVIVRSGAQVSGCADVAPLAASEARTVAVRMYDVPANLDALDADLVLTAQSAAHQQLDDAESAGVSRFTGGAADDAQWLLDGMAMRAAAATAFATARKTGGWDAKLALRFEGAAAVRVRLAALLASARRESFEFFRGRLSHTGGVAALVATGALGGTALGAGFGAVSAPVLRVEAGTDELVGGFSLGWSPRTFLHTLTERSVAASSSTVVDQLVLAAGCSEISATLTGTTTTEPFAGCDSSCAAGLCRATVEASWEAFALQPEQATLAVAFSGRAQLDEAANVTGLEGTFVGSPDQKTASGALFEGTALATPTAALPPLLE